MQNNDKNAHRHQQQIKKIKKNEPHAFLNLLSSPEICVIIEKSLPKYRQRLFCPTETLSIFLTQALSEDRSCQKAVNDYAVNKVVNKGTKISVSTSGYCKARQRLPLPMITNLVCETGKLIQGHVPDHWLWKNKSIYMVDGTTVSMPDTKENQSTYPQPSTQAEGVGFPMCRLVCAISLASGAIVNTAIAAYSGKQTGEQSLLRNMLGTFSSGDVLLGDAIYGTYFLFAALSKKGIDAVFEQMGSRNSDFGKGKKIGTEDHLIELKKPKKRPNWMTEEEYESSPKMLTIREVKIGKKCLITTFCCPKEVSKKDLKYLYKDRWHVELDLRNIKTTMGMDVLSCKTPIMIEKEIWVYFLAYNLIRLLIAQSALLANILPRKISFKHALQLWLSWCYKSISLDDEKVDLLFALIAGNRVGGRPGRIEPRAVKRRPKPFLIRYISQPRSKTFVSL
jgi:hypothetical protein